jgi:hypothetical protein
VNILLAAPPAAILRGLFRSRLMGAEKPLVTMWSIAALEYAGRTLGRLQARLLGELRVAANGASGIFAHTLELEDGTALLCKAREEDGIGWLVVVQLADVQRIEGKPGEEPFMGSKLKVLHALDTDDNKSFRQVSGFGGWES